MTDGRIPRWDRSSAIGHRPSAIGHRPSVIGHPTFEFLERRPAWLLRALGQESHELLTPSKLRHLALDGVGGFEDELVAITVHDEHRVDTGELQQLVDRDLPLPQIE